MIGMTWFTAAIKSQKVPVAMAIVTPEIKWTSLDSSIQACNQPSYNIALPLIATGKISLVITKGRVLRPNTDAEG